MHNFTFGKFLPEYRTCNNCYKLFLICGKKQIGIFRNTNLYSNMNINIWRPYTLIDTDKLNIIFATEDKFLQ